MVRSGDWEEEVGLSLATSSRHFENKPGLTTSDDSFDDRYEGRKRSWKKSAR